MNHKHFEEINSTQDYLSELKPEVETLISCESQLSGHGQYGRKWDADKSSLCFSFTLPPNDVLTLTSLEMGYLIFKYFQQEYNISLKLKWPNDLLTPDGKKVGGIIINNQSKDYLAVGIGLNYFPNQNKKEYRTPKGSIFSKEKSIDKKKESLKIYSFILKNRMNSISTIKNWNENCLHIDKKVSLIDSDQTYEGIFKGIGKNGEALIQTPSSLKTFYSGSIVL